MHAALVECEIADTQSLLDQELNDLEELGEEEGLEKLKSKHFRAHGCSLSVFELPKESGALMPYSRFVRVGKLFLKAMKKFKDERPAAAAVAAGAAAAPPGDVCPITQLPFEHKVQAKDGHFYERTAILRWCVLLNPSIIDAFAYS